MKKDTGKQPHRLFLIVLLAAMFIGIPIVKNGVFGLIHFDNLSIIYASLVYTCWYFYRKQSVWDELVRRYLAFIYFFMMLLEVNTVFKYTVFSYNITAVRYLWYFSYVPMLFVASFTFLLGLYIYSAKNDDRKIQTAGTTVLAVDVFFSVMIMTNDVHQLIFVADDTVENLSEDYHYGVMMYILWAFIIIQFLLFVVTIFNISRFGGRGKAVIYPLFVLTVSLAFNVFFVAGLFEKFLSFVVNTHYDAFIVFVICGIESCVYLGFIPTNVGYKDVFRKCFSAVILDKNNKPVYMSDNYMDLANDSNSRTVIADVPGGTFVYNEDISAMNNLIAQLDEVNSLLKEENDVRNYEVEENRKKAELETRNNLLNEISLSVEDKVRKMQELISGCGEGEGAGESFAKACVLLAYVKRRADFAVSMFENETADIRDLCIALSEVGRYLDRIDSSLSIVCNVSGRFSFPQIAGIFEVIGEMLGGCIESGDAVAIVIDRAEDGQAEVTVHSRYTETNDVPEESGGVKSGGMFVFRLSEENEEEGVLC